MAKDQWWIRNMDEATKRYVLAYAAMNGLTVAEALKELIAISNKALEGQK